MPRGLAKIQELAKAANERSRAFEAGEGGGVRALKLGVGESAVGRFCEGGDDVVFLYMHELPAKQNQRYGDRVQCLDQDDVGKPCPGCQVEGAKRTARVVLNFIRYDEPKLVRGADGKAVKDAAGEYQFDGVEPALVVWEASQANGGRIAYLEQENNGGDPHHGITYHVVKIFRAGKKEWNIDVVGKDKAPEPFEVELFNKKTDPAQAVQNLFPRFLSRPVMSFGDMQRAYSGAAGAGALAPGMAPGQAQGGDQSGNYYAQAAAAAAGGHVNPGALGN